MTGLCGRPSIVRVGGTTRMATMTKVGHVGHWVRVRKVLATSFLVTPIRYGRMTSKAMGHLGLLTTILENSNMISSVTMLRVNGSPLTYGTSNEGTLGTVSVTDTRV